MAVRALVTGGAGLIGSHIADEAIRQGYEVRILDNLERQTHREGKPAWISPKAEFIRGDVRNRSDWERALDGVSVVFHEAAFGGYMPEIAKFLAVNGVGSALMLEVIQDRRLPIDKIVFASSQAVYNEGAYSCSDHGHFYGKSRPIAQLETGDYAMHCPVCGAPSTPVPTDENAPIGGENIYAISKSTQERTILSWSKAIGIPAVALRYSCTYGPRQSVFNPYTGVIAIFCTRLMNDLAPVIFEDGHQSRDLIFVEDVARANLLVAGDGRANNRIFNVGTGNAAEIGALAELLATKLNRRIAPQIPGTFRPGEMRALISDTTALAELGFTAQTNLSEGIDRYLEWIGTQGDIRDYFTAAERALRKRRVIKPAQSDRAQ